MNKQSCLFEILPIVNAFFFLRPPGPFLAWAGFLPFLPLAARSAILVTKKPRWRMSCWASSWVAASMVSLTSLPVWSIASNWKVGIGVAPFGRSECSVVSYQSKRGWARVSYRCPADN